VFESRGLVYQDMGDHVQAVRDFDSAVQKDENYAEVYFYRGNSKVELHQYEDAIEDYNR